MSLAPPAGGCLYSESFMGHLVRALVIDDDRVICQLLAESLAPHGYKAVAAHTGPDVPARALAPDNMDGFEVLRRIRARSVVPVPMLTARGSEKERIFGDSCGGSVLCRNGKQRVLEVVIALQESL